MTKAEIIAMLEEAQASLYRRYKDAQERLDWARSQRELGLMSTEALSGFLAAERAFAVESDRAAERLRRALGLGDDE